MAGDLQTLEAAQEPSRSHKPQYAKLTRSDIGVLLKLKRDGLTQTEVAKRLGCNQSTVSRWWDEFEDTTDQSKAYLRGQALRMAQHIVKKGRAADHVAALKGLSVLQEERSAGVVVQIGIKDSDVSITLGSSAALSPRGDV